MALKSKIRWVALMGLALSALSLAIHFLLARFYRNEVQQVDAHEIQALMGWSSNCLWALDRQTQGEMWFLVFLFCLISDDLLFQDPSYGKVWSRVKHLQSLRPYAVPRKAYPGKIHFFFVKITVKCS